MVFIRGGEAYSRDVRPSPLTELILGTHPGPR